MKFLSLIICPLIIFSAATSAAQSKSAEARKCQKNEIVISAASLFHITQRHDAGELFGGNTSQFLPSIKIEDLLRTAEKTPPHLVKNNYCARTVDAGHLVGILKREGVPTSVYTVITDQEGNLITVFPNKFHERRVLSK